MPLMPFFSRHAGHARLLALAGAVSAVMGASAIRPAFAGDDGYEPIWSGLGGIVGLTTKEREAAIDYRERGRLVLPPKMDLPAPISPDAQKTAAWPLDPGDAEELPGLAGTVVATAQQFAPARCRSAGKSSET